MMKRALTLVAALLPIAVTISVAGVPVTTARANDASNAPVSPRIFDLGPANTWTQDLQVAFDRAVNPPIYVSNLPGLDALPSDLGYVATAVEIDAKTTNTVTCSYATPSWFDGQATGNADWTGGPLMDAYVEGSDDALGVSYDTKSSSATSEVGMWLHSNASWPTPSSVTVDYRWGGVAYMQADADVSVLAGTGASSAIATYAIDGQLLADSLTASRHFYDRTITANGTRPSSTANVNVRWDDTSGAVVPTLRVAMHPDMDLISKLIGSMSDSATPNPGANASAGVDAMHKGDTYLTGSQHFTFTLPRGKTISDCGGDGVKS